MEESDRLLVETIERAKSNQHRIEKLEETTADIHELASSVRLMAQSIERMTEELREQGERLTALERQPAERWNSMTRTLITSAASTLAGGVVGALIALLVR